MILADSGMISCAQKRKRSARRDMIHLPWKKYASKTEETLRR
jgi:hypothetical protein